MTKLHNGFVSAAGLALAAVLAVVPAGAQQASASQGQTASPSSDLAAAPAQNPDAVNGTYATGKPIEMQSKEGFFGHLNPFARKKWVHRQLDPIADRANELDQLQAKNANDIRDVDARATSGVNRAMAAANTADGHAGAAQSRADAANSLAVTADGKTTSLHGTVSNLDQYSTVSETALPFAAGRTVLTAKQKANLDDVATALANQKGYIVEVQGFSRGGVTASQAMADSVVRYLVTAHQIPLYRIYRTGLGKAQPEGASTEASVRNGVKVTVLHNSLANMDAPAAPVPAGS